MTKASGMIVRTRPQSTSKIKQKSLRPKDAAESVKPHAITDLPDIDA